MASGVGSESDNGETVAAAFVQPTTRDTAGRELDFQFHSCRRVGSLWAIDKSEM